MIHNINVNNFIIHFTTFLGKAKFEIIKNGCYDKTYWSTKMESSSVGLSKPLVEDRRKFVQLE